MDRLDGIKWPVIAGFAVGVIIAGFGIAKTDWVFLVIGACVVIASLAITRLKDLGAGKEGLRASFFQSIAQDVATEVVKEAPPAPAPKVMERSVEDSVTSLDEATAVVTRDASGQGQADIVPPDIAGSRDARELARRVVEYLRQAEGSAGQRLPRLRGLSPARIKAEQDLFGAILELQSDRHRSGDLGTDDPYERVITGETVSWWNDPSSLDDEAVTDLARRVRDLIDHRMKRDG